MRRPKAPTRAPRAETVQPPERASVPANIGALALISLRVRVPSADPFSVRSLAYAAFFLAAAFGLAGVPGESAFSGAVSTGLVAGLVRGSPSSGG